MKFIVACLALLLSRTAKVHGCIELSPFQYERIPNQVNTYYVAIGGCGGVPFSYHSYGSAVQHIKVWKNGSELKCISFSTFDRESFTIGEKPVGDPQSKFTFEVGEKLNGPMVLTGNGIGTRTGYIKLTTSLGNTFEAGTSKTHYTFMSNDSYLMGFFGRHGAAVDALGFYLMKEIDNEYLADIDYDLNGYDPNKRPQRFIQHRYENDNSNGNEYVASITKLTSQTREWDVRGSFSFTYGGEVSAGVPGVSSASAHWELTVGIEAGYTSTKFESDEIKEEVTVSLPACSSGVIDITWFSDAANIDFTANVRYEFTDGTSLDLPIEGTYFGVLTSQVYTDIDTELYTPGEAKCAHTKSPTFSPNTISPTFYPTFSPTTISPTFYPTLVTTEFLGGGPTNIPTSDASPFNLESWFCSLHLLLCLIGVAVLCCSM